MQLICTQFYGFKNSCQIQIFLEGRRDSHRRVVANMLDRNKTVSSNYSHAVHFHSWEKYELSYFSSNWLVPLLIFYKDGFGIK